MKNRTYDKEFKINAVELYKNGKKPAEICKDLDIPDATFWQWKKAYEKEGKKSFPGSGNMKPENEDMTRIKKELADVKLERDILKKAVAIFSKQQL
jgi:transposase